MSKIHLFLISTSALLLTQSGCMSAYVKSVGGDRDQVFTKIFRTDFDTAWQSVLESLKSSPLEQSNREAGFIQTKWIENTSERNFIDSFGSGRTYLKAQFRFRVTVVKGFFDGKPAIKISAQKDQYVQYDILDGWKPIVSDAIDENTLLYRIGRLIFIRMRIAQVEEQKASKALKEAEKDL